MNVSDYVIDRVRLDIQRESPLMFGGNRWNFLPDLFNAMKFTVGAEIGVAGGRFSKHLCNAVNGLKMYAIDPWEAYEYYQGRYNQSSMDRTYRKAVETLSPLNCEIIKEYSAQAVKRFDDNSLDFVYIDANRTFESVCENLTIWTDKVKPGGVISGCCYYNMHDRAICRVKDAVDWYTEMHNIDPWFIIVHYRYPVYFWEKR